MKAVDLAQRIEDTRFLGREFVVFLWFLSELDGGDVTTLSHGAAVVRFDASLVLERKAETTEVCRLRGLTPSEGREAKEALRDGKLPTRAHLLVALGERSFALLLNADTLALSSVKLPELLAELEDEAFFERMQLIEELESVLESLFEEFVRMRLHPVWDAALAPAIRKWVREDDALSADAYRALRDRSLVGAPKKKRT